MEILIVAPRGPGGVAAVVEVMAPRVGAAWVSARPVPLATIARTSASVVHLHPSLRSRALLRDSATFAAVWARSLPAVVHWHGWDRRRAAAFRGLVCTGLGRAAVTAAAGESIARQLRSWGIDVAVVPNPFDPARIPATRIPTDRPVILYVGRLTEAKGVLALARAAPAVDGAVVFVGDGPLRPAVEALGLTVTGWLESAGVREWLARAAVLVLPSAEETSPVAVIEALAAGVPVIAAPQVDGTVPLDSFEPLEIARAIRAVVAGDHPPTHGVAQRIWATHHPDVVAARWSHLYGLARSRS